MIKNFFLVVLLILFISVIKIEAADNSIDKVEEAFLRDDYEQAHELAKDLIANRRVEKAYEDKVYYILALCQLKQSQYEDAKNNFEILITRYPSSAFVDDAYIGIGDCFYLKDNFEQAYSTYKEIIDRKLSNKDTLCQAYLKLGKAAQKLGRWQQARDLYNYIVTKYPSSFEAKAAADYINEGDFFFTLQLGAFSKLENARKLRDELQGKGYDAMVYNLDVSGKTFYRVRVGKFAAKEEAQLMQARLQKDRHSSRIFP